MCLRDLSEEIRSHSSAVPSARSFLFPHGHLGGGRVGQKTPFYSPAASISTVSLCRSFIPPGPEYAYMKVG